MSVRGLALGVLVAACVGALACTEDDGSPTGPDPRTLVRILVDDAREAGRHVVAWDQKDDLGVAVEAGTYRAVMRVGDCKNGEIFDIVALSRQATFAPAKPDTGDEPPIPTEFTITTGAITYGIGDPVEITIELPRQGEVLLWIERAID